MVGVTGSSSEQKRVSMKAYYSYYLHDRANHYNYLSRTGRPFQQYVVTAFCAIKQNRIDYVREHQNDIRNEYLSGIYDAINRGDNNGFDYGSRLILPQSFTVGPRYMYSHYLDALAICRVHDNLEELTDNINTPNWNHPAFYNNDDDDVEYTIAITPVLSTKEPDNSLSMRDEHLDTVPATESDEVIKSSVEILVPIPSESEDIPDKMCDVPFRDNSLPLGISKDQFEGFSDSNYDSTSIDDDSFSIDDIDYVEASPPDSELVSLEEVKDFHTEEGEIEDDILREKLSKINLLIAKIEAINSNPPPSSDFVIKSSSTSLNFFLKETNTFDNSIPESETFCFDLEENNSGSTTTRSDYSLLDYEAFYFNDDYIEEKSSGSTTTHSDISLSKYDSFIFDLSNDPFPPTDRSDFYHEEFADELAHIISLPKYDCFYFKSEPDLGELTSIVDSGIRENILSTTNVNLPFEDDQSPLLAYVVWIFLSFLTYPVAPPYLLSCGNEDTIFDPGISVYHSFMPSVSHRSGTFMKFNVYPNHLNESPMEILSSTCSPMDQ
ncbi:ribonuclease H-like domain-containing protein [Tanacetum coccineum]